MINRTKPPTTPPTTAATSSGQGLEDTSLAIRTDLPSADDLIGSPRKFVEKVAEFLSMNPGRMADLRESLLGHGETEVVSATLYGIAKFDKQSAVEEARNVIMKGNDASPGAFVVLNQLTMTEQDRQEGRLSRSAYKTLGELTSSSEPHLKILGENLLPAFT